MLNPEDCLIICIDIQEKLVKILDEKNKYIPDNIIKIMKSASILNIDTIITEQYPKGLGKTISDIKEIKDFKTIEKTSFSVFQTPEIKEEILKLNKKQIILFGIETHICVLQSAIDLAKKGFEVFLVCDCCASRSIENHNVALDLAKQMNVKIASLEIILFDLLKTSKHVNFKEIQGLIK